MVHICNLRKIYKCWYFFQNGRHHCLLLWQWWPFFGKFALNQFWLSFATLWPATPLNKLKENKAYRMSSIQSVKFHVEGVLSGKCKSFDGSYHFIYTPSFACKTSKYSGRLLGLLGCLGRYIMMIEREKERERVRVRERESEREK